MMITGMMMMMNDAFGQVCTPCSFGSASGTTSISVGGSVVGAKSGAFGPNSGVWGVDSYAMGVAEVGTSSVDADGGFAIGVKSFVYGDNSISIGHKVETDASDSYSYIFGSGLLNTQFVNNISNSIMFGMNSDVSTMFIEDAGGSSGGIGRVGIGTTDPDGLLHLLEESAASATDLILEKYANTHARIRFFTGNTENGQILMDDVEDLRLINSTTDRNIRIFVNDGGSSTEAIRVEGSSANVGIGSVSPNGRLHVYSSGANTDLVLEKDATTRARLRFRENGAFIGSLELTDQEDWLLQNLVESRHMLFSVNIAGTQATAMYIQGNSGNVGIGTTSPTEILHINGRGRSTQAAWETTSDERIKENIQPIEGARTILNLLNPVTYEWVGPYLNAHPFLPTHNWGFIAQEVEQVVPDMVSTVAEENVGDSTNPLVLQDLKLLNHSPLFPILVKGFQELDGQVADQQQTIDGLQSTVDSLLSIVASCCQNVGPSFRYGDLGSSEIQGNNASFILFQNDPNPFQYSTEIGYSVPSSVQRAELLITDMNGRVVKRIPIGNGDGQITIYSSDLNSGIYSYSLLGDGRILESKKMVCTK